MSRFTILTLRPAKILSRKNHTGGGVRRCGSSRFNRKYSIGFQRKGAKAQRCSQAAIKVFLDCGGKRSATPLWKLCPQSKSGVAAALCQRSPKSSRFVTILTNSGDY
jgi:hypothetical protein